MCSRLRFGQATHKDVIDPDVARGISRTTMPGSGNWLSFIPTISNENLVAPLEFRYALCKRYLLPIVKPPTACDGCQQPFTLNHALNCPIGGLTIRRHNEIRDELAYLAAMAYGPSAVRLEPFILNEREMVPITSIPPGYPPTSIPNYYPHSQVNPNHDELLGRFISEFSEFPEISNENVPTRTADPEPEASNIPPPTEPLLALTGERGDLAIRGFWEKQTE
jgi:hypothetical protein